MTREELQFYLGERAKASDLWNESTKRYHSAFYMIACGAIVMSVAYCRQPSSHLDLLWLILVSWLSLLSSIALGIQMSYSETTLRSYEINRLDSWSTGDLENEQKMKIMFGRLAKTINCFSTTSTCLLYSGLVLLTIFMYVNICKQNHLIF